MEGRGVYRREKRERQDQRKWKRVLVHKACAAQAVELWELNVWGQGKVDRDVETGVLTVIVIVINRVTSMNDKREERTQVDYFQSVQPSWITSGAWSRYYCGDLRVYFSK